MSRKPLQRPIKRSAIPLSGYMYQNLVGLGVLCDWLDDPTLYRWVTFECDEDGEKIEGLDDVVAVHQDGTALLMQVKFTVDATADANALGWDWLTARRPKGRSLLQKWADAYFWRSGQGPVDASLLTNRRPDRAFAACLSEQGETVDIRKVPQGTLRVLSEQLGDDRVEPFLGVFKFRHSRQGDLALERSTQDRYVPRHTTSYGWLALRHEAINWALRTASPAPDGRITIGHLRTVLDQKRPKPLEQDFHVPPGYEPPDQAFYEFFVDAIHGGQVDKLLLWGSPGQGKSTFLSYVCKELDRRETPYIRHHYFLKLGDSEDRFTFSSVANSLMTQIEWRHAQHIHEQGSDPERIREWITACAEGYEEAGKPFVVIIDGLDHVWRENEGDRAPMDSLFGKLFPLPANVVLVMGSQKVDAMQLPRSFVDFVDAADWIELPRMSISAVTRWLHTQREGGRFELAGHHQHLAQAMTDLAEAFHDVSDGHPLILTYSFEQLVRGHRLLTKDLVMVDAAISGGDIGHYYATLWQRLSFEARDALHLLADTGFVWPVNGLEECLDIRGGRLQPEIGHLVHASEAGLMAFHGSLLVFVVAQPEHGTSIERTLGRVTDWLAQRAPPFLRWGWLWLYQARGGSPEPLMEGTTRVWVIDSLMSAYPVWQIEAILEAAERIAFSGNDFPKALRLRWLKTNVLNGPEFQIEDFRQVIRRAVELGSDDYVVKLMASGHRRTDEYDLYLLGLFYLASDRKEDAKLYQDRLRTLINDKINAGAYQGREIEKEVRRYLRLAARTGDYSPENVAKTVRGFGSASRRLLASFTSLLGVTDDLSALVALHSQELKRFHKSDIELEIIRTAGRTGAAIHEWPAFRTFEHHPIVACWSVIHGVTSPNLRFRPRSIKVDTIDYQEQLDRTHRHLHDVFFNVLACSLLRKAIPDLEALDSEQEWLQSARDKLAMAATRLATTLRRGDRAPFDRVFRLMEEVEPPTGPGAHRDYVGFRRSLLSISSDLFALMMSRAGLECVPDAEWNRALGSQHFLVGQWLALVESGLVPPLSADAAARLIEAQSADISDNYSYFNERADRYLELCVFAIHIGSLDAAEVLLRRAISCVIGYGWRKNSELNDTVEAVAAVSAIDEPVARACIERLSPVITHISEMTEDDAFRSFDVADLLIELMPDVFPAFYQHLMRESEWYYAERTFSALLSRIDLGTPTGRMVAGAVWDADGMDAIRQNAVSDQAEIGRQLALIADRFGRLAGETSERSTFRSSDLPDEDPVDVSRYGATDLGTMMIEVGESRLTLARTALDQWFDQNVTAGQGIDVLKELEPFLSDSRWLSPVTALFDKAFELSLRLQGKKAAYKWLVAAQIGRHGWDRYYDDEAQSRFARFAAHYRKDWCSFVHETARSPYRSSPGLVIPSNRLVELMVAVDEPEEAVALTLAMVDSVLEDFADQPLRRPSWIEGGPRA